MSMLLDGPPSSIGDLTVRDSELLSLASAEGIDLSAKLQLAAAEINCAVESMLLSMLAASAETHGQRFPSMRHIAVTPQLKRWHTFVSLRLVYQDLFFTRLNDRYQAKLKMYRDEEQQALDDLRTTGLGVVFDPLPQAPAPSISMTPASNAGGTIYVAISYLNQRGEEGLPGVPVEADIPSGNMAGVSLTALADNASGWNLYAGISPDALYRQNASALDPLAQCTLAPDTLASGPEPGTGQRANRLYPLPRRILRG